MTKKYTVEVSDEENKALLTDMISIQEWLDNAIHNKARQCIDRIVDEHSDKKLSRMTVEEKLAIVRSAKVKTAAERTAEMEP